jgi:deoxyribodipyrimidine photo-lyase
MSIKFNTSRARKLSEHKLNREGDIWYWMSRDQRVQDNWALIFAVKLAQQESRNVGIVFCMQTEFLRAGNRQFQFMSEGLAELVEECENLQIPFKLLDGSPEDVLPGFINQEKVAALVTDFSPLRIKKQWLNSVLDKVSCPVFEVDAHNIIPTWAVSDKCEFAAYTIRPKIHKLLPEYLTDFPKISKQDQQGFFKKYHYTGVFEKLAKQGESEQFYVKTFTGGSLEGNKILKKFLTSRLSQYDERNDPNALVSSDLSPYLHFGQISPQRAAWELYKDNSEYINKDKHPLEASFLEELIVRRELSDNFCYYNSDYDNFNGFHSWAQTTLNEHRDDKRSYVYSCVELEEAKTHDPLWNAAQHEMVITGKMHGYLRMYWAKKILEWTESPEQALEFGIKLNDRYELDGRDPNGYVGIAWSVGGVHDRAWNERPVFGKIRFMSYDGCKRKFDVDEYISRIDGLRKQVGLATELDDATLL